MRFGPTGLQVDTWAHPPEPADAVVAATGAWLPELARPLGVRLPVQAGRGYSFSAGADQPWTQPVYLPAARVALTPLGDREAARPSTDDRGPGAGTGSVRPAAAPGRLTGPSADVGQRDVGSSSGCDSGATL